MVWGAICEDLAPRLMRGCKPCVFGIHGREGRGLRDLLDHDLHDAQEMRRAGYFALSAATVYCAATAAGSVLDRSYSQLAQPISDLTATGAPTRAVLVVPYALYNLLCVAFAVGLYRASDRSRLFKVGLALLTINAIAGLMMVTCFPEEIGAVATAAGIGHVAWAALSSAAVVALAFVFGFAFRHLRQWRRLSAFSMAVGIGFTILGPIAAFAIASKSPLGGLAERGPIGLFILWLLVIGGHAARNQRAVSSDAISPSGLDLDRSGRRGSGGR